MTFQMKQNRRSFLRNTALLGGAVTLRSLTGRAETPALFDSLPASSSGPESTGSSEVRRLFSSPPKKYRPMVRWWWPGNDVAEAELRREIDVLDKAGIGGAEIQSFVKGFTLSDFSAAAIERMSGFATPSFFKNVGVAAEEAQKRGMFIDYTFGSGWPFGGGLAITPELASIELRSTHLSITGPAPFDQHLQIPSVTDSDLISGVNKLQRFPEGWAERLKKRTKVVAVVAVRGETAQWNFHHAGGRGERVIKPGRLEQGTSIDLTANLQPDGRLQWDVPAGTWQLFVFCSVPTLQRVNGAAGGGPQLVMDHMSTAAFAAHAKRVGDDAVPYIGRYFGNGLRAIFCDSLEVSANLFWSDDFVAEFARRRGYNLVPFLPILKLQTYNEPFGTYIDIPVFDMPEIGAQLRRDYQQTVSDLMVERFYEQFNKWAHDHKLLSRTQAHGAPADVLRIYGEADIPETEDLYDEGQYDFLKMAASAANVYGRAIVGSESFVWPTALYQTTPEKMKVAADELLTAGVNAIVYHGFPYIVPEIPPPGWHPFNGTGDGNYSSQLNELNPFWPYLRALNGYMTRVQYLSQIGTNVAAVALYRNDLLHGAEEAPPPPKLNEALLGAGYNYDHINADSLLRCTAADANLVTAGGARYRALIFPAAQVMDAALVAKLETFASAGLPIFIAGQTLPDFESPRVNASEAASQVAAIHALRRHTNVHFINDEQEIPAALNGKVEPNIHFHSQSLPFIQKRIGKMNIFFLRNPSDSARTVDAEFQGDGDPELWDAWTGKSEAISNSQRMGNWTRIKLELQPFASALIVFAAEDAAQAPAVAAAARRLEPAQEIGKGGWKLVATRFDASARTIPIHRDLPQLIDWSLDSELRDFSGQGVYTTKFTIPSIDAGKQYVLDLGAVKDVAEVKVNGKAAATLLLRPYRTDITGLVNPGKNLLEIAVTNTLYNTMVLRAPRTFQAGPTGNPSGLMSSGLLGPVQLEISE